MTRPDRSAGSPGPHPVAVACVQGPVTSNPTVPCRPAFRRRSWLWILAAFFLVTSIVGAVTSQNGASSPVPARSAPPAAAADPARIADDPAVTQAAYLRTLTQKGIRYASPGAAVDLAQTICSAYRSGSGTLQVANAVASTGVPYTLEQDGDIIGAATAAYCPQFSPTGS